MLYEAQPLLISKLNLFDSNLFSYVLYQIKKYIYINMNYQETSRKSATNWIIQTNLKSMNDVKILVEFKKADVGMFVLHN